MEIDEISQICLSLPGVQQDIKWENDLCFMIEAKMFCVVNLKGPLGLTFKVPAEQFDEWLEKEGVSPAPYLARAQWVMITDFSSLSIQELTAAITRSYKIILSKLPIKIRAKWEEAH